MRLQPMMLGALGLAASLATALALPAQQNPPPAAQPRPAVARDTSRTIRNFRHSVHRDLPCSGCHSSQQRHGQVVIRSEQDCQRCHHIGPGREDCARCHDVTRLRRGAPQPRAFQITAARATISLQMRFDHQPHATVACGRCHGDAMSRAPAADCAACHAQHHGPAAECTECHQAANALAKHTVADHTRCSAPACHGQQAETLPLSSREACLVCHNAQRQHIPGRTCITCHPVRTS